MSDLSLWLPIVAGFIAIGYGVITTQRLMALPTGSARMQEIAKAIQEGANAYLARQLRTLGIFAVVVFFLLFLLPADDMGQFMHNHHVDLLGR